VTKSVIHIKHNKIAFVMSSTKLNHIFNNVAPDKLNKFVTK